MFFLDFFEDRLDWIAVGLARMNLSESEFHPHRGSTLTSSFTDDPEHCGFASADGGFASAEKDN